MEAASLRPPGLPPSALLCVRRLRDPLPGDLRLDSGALRPSAEWERAAVDALARTAATAARPAHGPVPPGAEAVLFADRAELLASLARDWLSGELGSRWWWPLLLRTRSPAETTVANTWLATAEHVPAALEQLVRSRHAAEFVSALPISTVVAMVEAVALVHGLPPPEAGMVKLKESGAARPVAPSVATAGQRPRGRARAEAPALPPVPWRGVVPEADEPGLAPAAGVLLGVALTLVRSPERARTKAFAAAAARRLAPAAVDEPPLPPSFQPAPAAETPRTPALPSALRPYARPAPAQPAQTTPEPPPENPATYDALAPAARELPALMTPADGRAPAKTPAPVSPANNSTARPSAPRAQPLRTAEPPLRSEPEPLLAGTRTELAGLFYLLNLALALELYGDFTHPLDRPLRLVPWDLLTLLGRELLRGAHADDPVWSLLARLAGRAPDDPPGARFRPARDLRLPPAWLEPFDDDGTPWRYAATGGRLSIQHPARFTVVDVPLGRNPRIHLARALRPYGRPLCAAGLFRRERVGATPLELWVSHLAGYTRARLQLALGVEERAIAQTMLVQPARIFVTATHVDVVAPLAELAVEVRFAGLDRDPGWIPAAGRDVRFHFE